MNSSIHDKFSNSLNAADWQVSQVLDMVRKSAASQTSFVLFTSNKGPSTLIHVIYGALSFCFAVGRCPLGKGDESGHSRVVTQES